MHLLTLARQKYAVEKHAPGDSSFMLLVRRITTLKHPLNFLRMAATSLVFGALLLPMAVQAIVLVQPPTFGVATSANTAGNCPSFCRGGEFSSTEGGGEFALSASSSNSTYAQASASASFASAQNLLPEMHAFASSDVGRRGSGTAFAIQAYRYTGALSRAVQIDLALTGSVADNASGYVSNNVSASVAVLRAEQLGWSTDFGSVVFESGSERLDLIDLGINAPGVNMATGMLSFDIDPGDLLFVVARLSAGAQNGVADANNTLVLSFGTTGGGAAGLQAISAVPEVSTVWMALAGLLVLARRHGAFWKTSAVVRLA